MKTIDIVLSKRSGEVTYKLLETQYVFSVYAIMCISIDVTVCLPLFNCFEDTINSKE